MAGISRLPRVGNVGLEAMLAGQRIPRAEHMVFDQQDGEGVKSSRVCPRGLVEHLAGSNPQVLKKLLDSLALRSLMLVLQGPR